MIPVSASVIPPELEALCKADDLKPVSQIVKEKTGRRIAPSSTWRYVRQGLKGCKLGAVCIGGIWYTNDACWAEFVKGQTAAMLGGSAATPSARTVSDDQLAAAGIL